MSIFSHPRPWQAEIQDLWKNLVPPKGEAETLQGELVRSIQNLADEAYRNGWMNWDSANEDEIRFLKHHLKDEQTFSTEERQLIQEKLERILYAGTKGADEGCLGYEEIKYVAERVVLWCRSHQTLIYKTGDKSWLDS